MKLQRDLNSQPLSGCGFDCRCILRYRPCFEQGIPSDIQAATEYRFILKRMWHDKNTQSKENKYTEFVLNKLFNDEDILRLRKFLVF